MRALVQRVTQSRVVVDGHVVGEIGAGLLILLGVKTGDTEAEAKWLADKCAGLRIFENDAGKFDRSLLETGGQALVVSQFTLYGDCRRGRRPSFTDAARPDEADRLYLCFVQALRNLGVDVATGVFAAHMAVEIHNDGPVTLMIDTEEKR